MKLAVASLSVLAACVAYPRHSAAQAPPVSAALAPGDHNAVLNGVRFVTGVTPARTTVTTPATSSTRGNSRRRNRANT